MDIIQRNLFRLLRSGAYGTQEQLEPMSVFKWERLYQIAMLHDVIPYAYKGISNCRSQFFMHLTEKQLRAVALPQDIRIQDGQSLEQLGKYRAYA